MSDAAVAAAKIKLKSEAITAALVLNPRVAPASTTSTRATTTTAPPPPPPPSDQAPKQPPVVACGNEALLDGPSTPPPGAVRVPAGDNHGMTWQPNETYWFAPGLHTLGEGQYDQIIPADNDIFVGAPGAIIDGQGKNNYAFTQHATNVMIQHLTIRNFVAPLDQGVVNHDSGDSWTIANNTIVHNTGAALMAGCATRSSATTASPTTVSTESNAYQAGNGITNLVFDHNEIAGNNTDKWEDRPRLWMHRRRQVLGRQARRSRTTTCTTTSSVGLWADTNNRDFLFKGNYISDNDAEGIMYEISYNASIRNNTFIRNGTRRRTDQPRLSHGGDLHLRVRR